MAIRAKADGFRRLVFREGSKIQLRSKSLKPLTRYFPEVAVALERLETEDVCSRRRICHSSATPQPLRDSHVQTVRRQYQDKGTDPALVHSSLSLFHIRAKGTDPALVPDCGLPHV